MMLSVSLEGIMEIIEVEFEHGIYVMTDTMYTEEYVLCVIKAEVVPMDGVNLGPTGHGGQVQIISIEVVDERFYGLTIHESDLTSDEYDKIEDRAYEIAAPKEEEYTGYWH
tara:strand:+ start:5466 stop:5798 length:333 start_codon:yes stop_codon:yes gene_type:complete